MLRFPRFAEEITDCLLGSMLTELLNIGSKPPMRLARCSIVESYPAVAESDLVICSWDYEIEPESLLLMFCIFWGKLGDRMAMGLRIVVFYTP